MSDKSLQIGQKVEVNGKNVRGQIAYIGVTTFAVGKWVGVILDEPKGKNNGSIKGHSYFTCPENHGMFVRPTQLTLLDALGNPIPADEQESGTTRSRLSSVNSSASVRSISSTTAKPTAVRRKSPVKAPQSLKQRQQTNNASSNLSISMSSSRLSLTGSRQSLLGSRSQLASPAIERPATSQSVMSQSERSGAMMTAITSNEKRTNITPPEFITGSSKRESFVETGFLETLRPQFTPGQSLTTPLTTGGGGGLSTEEKLNALQQQQEIDDLKTQVKDLTEKLETIKQRRTEDKERLKEFDKMKTQFEQLQEFKSKIMEAQSQLQRDLQRAKQETRDAIEARDQHAEEMLELSESVELITLDKEMAEEKADTLQTELEAAKERVEELTLDLEILRTEMQNKSSIESITTNADGTITTAGISTYEFKQLEQQNVRLRDTLVRLRDLSAHEKHEIQKITKELDTKKSEVAELQKTKEKLSIKIDELESQVVDLQEQVDAALGAEEMVEQLADKKMELEDKVKQLEEEVAELEALEDVHDQLVESNHELEMDLREELDMALAAKREMIREKDAAFETILDRDQTILKFRELVQRLNDQIQDLRDKVKTEPSNQQGGKDMIAAAETIDFKQMFAETKAYTRAIDLQLRQIELTEANEHVRLLTAYMPDTFMTRGGDHDSIILILLVSRIVFKAGIIVNQVRDRFSPVSAIDRNAVLQGHSIQQFTFRSRLLYYIHNLQAIMHQFLYGVNTCDPEILLKTGASVPEMTAQEKNIDAIIELLKANQLDENSSTDNIEKCIIFFNAMYSVHMANENLMNETQLIRDCTAAIQASCDSIYTDCNVMKTLIKGGDEISESGLLLQYVVQTTDNIKQQMKLIKRRLPHDSSIIKCGLSSKTITNLKSTSEQLGKAMSALFITSKVVQQTIALNSGGSGGGGNTTTTTTTAADTDNIPTDLYIDNTKLMEILSAAFEKIYEQDDRGPSHNLKTLLTTTNTDMSQLAQYLLDNEYEIMSMASTTTAVTAATAPNANQLQNIDKIRVPIALRAQFIKTQLEETKTLTAQLENREAEIRQLKLAAKMKLNELSEMQIRKDLAEKKLSVLQNDHEVNTEKLQRKYEEVSQLLNKKEKEFEETMDHLQSDIDSLESERGALREKLKGYGSKKGDLKASTAFDITANSPYIGQELSLLKKAFIEERSERIKLQAKEMNNILSSLKPIKVPLPEDNRVEDLKNELLKVKYDYIMTLVDSSGFPSGEIANPNVSRLIKNHRNKYRMLRENVKARVEGIASEILTEYLNRKPHRSIQSDFKQFPSVEMTRAFQN